MWQVRGNPGQLSPIKETSEFVNYVVNLRSKADKRNVTKFRVSVASLNCAWNNRNELYAIDEKKDAFKNLEEFKRLKEDELQQLVQTELMDSQGDPDPTNPKGLDFLKKSDHLSSSFRAVGNDFFKASNYQKALRCYTFAASFAPTGSNAERLAYSNRSACFAELEDWKTCLEDITRFENVQDNTDGTGTFSDGLQEKISRRKRRCLDKLTTTKDGGAEAELNEDIQFARELMTALKNESTVIPSAEDFVGVKVDREKGRCLYNKSDSPIEPGTLIILEKAYAHAPYETLCFHARNCNACFRQLHGSGIPCSTCVFTLYCSEACATSEFSINHCKYECKMSPYIYELNISRVTHLSLLVLLKLGPKGLLAQLQEPKGDPQKFSGLQSDGKYPANSYDAISKLSWSQAILDKSDLIEYSRNDLILTHILDITTDYFTSLLALEPSLDLTWVKSEFCKLLLQHQMIVSTNGITLDRMLLNSDRPTPTEIAHAGNDFLGIGLFPVACLLNHSCDPNVSWDALPDGKLAVFTIQQIVPGQEFHTIYGPHYSSSGRIQRRLKLQSGYAFLCKCPPCKYDWRLGSETGVKICPKCRVKLDLDRDGQEVFAEIKLNETSLKMSCPKCDWEMKAVDFQRDFRDCQSLKMKAVLRVTSNEAKAGFEDALGCVKFRDSYFMKPDATLGENQETLKHALWLLAKKLWR